MNTLRKLGLAVAIASLGLAPLAASTALARSGSVHSGGGGFHGGDFGRGQGGYDHRRRGYDHFYGWDYGYYAFPDYGPPCPYGCHLGEDGKCWPNK